MASLLVRLLAVAGVTGIGWGGLVRLEVFVTDDVRAWRRLARLRGYARPRSGIEKLATQTALLQRVQAELDLSRLLAIAGRSETPLGFLGRTAAYSLGGAAAFLAVEGLSRAASGDWLLGLSPLCFIFVALIVAMVCLVQLRVEARRAQEQSGRALGDMLMLVAILTDGRGLQLDDAVRILSRCADTGALAAIVDEHGFRRLVRQRPASTIDLYRQIGTEYGIPMFGRLADAAANSNVGFPERDVYTRLARSVYEQRLAEARVRAARARTLVTIPVAGMLIPLLLLLGAPTVASLAAALR